MKYTKMFTLLCSALLLNILLQQEVSAQITTKAGIKGGLNVSNLYLDDVSDENARIGTHIGLFANFSPAGALGFQTELLFSTKGSVAQYDGVINQEVKYNLSYLDLPVLAVFKVGETVEIHAGGYASYLLAANISYQGDLGNGSDDIDKDNLKSYDYGLALGVGINVGPVQIGARYNYGLVEIAESDNAKALLGNSKNSCAQLFAAFAFRGK